MKKKVKKLIRTADVIIFGDGATWFFRVWGCFLVVAGLLLGALTVVTLCRCGAMEKAVEEMQPDITVINYIPGDRGGKVCSDCPAGYEIADFKAVDLPGGEWAAGLIFNGQCPAGPAFTSVKLSIWEYNGYSWGNWGEAEFGQGECINNIMAWWPLPQPCPEKTWCGIKEPWVGIAIIDYNGFYYQFFTQPGGEIPGMGF